MAALILDGYVFEGFEIPEEVELGGSQAGELTRLPGGIRTFDASGPDDAPISWSGRARGSSAIARAMQLDGMRRAGGQRQLAVLGLSYSVVVHEFRFKIRRPFEIEYRIELLVIADQAQGLFGTVAATLDTLVSADLTSAIGLLGAAPPLASAAVAAYQGAINAAGSLQGSALVTLAPLLTSGAAASAQLDATVEALDASMATDAFDASRPDRGATAMRALLAEMEAQSDLVVGSAYLARSVKNLANATG